MSVVLDNAFRIGLRLITFGYFLNIHVAFPTLDQLFAIPSVILSRMRLPSRAPVLNFFSISAFLDTVIGLPGSFSLDNLIPAVVCGTVAIVSSLSLLDRLLSGRVKRFIYTNALPATHLSLGILSCSILISSFKSYSNGSIPLTTLWLGEITASVLFAIPSMLMAPATSPGQKSMIGKLFCVANAMFASYFLFLASSHLMTITMQVCGFPFHPKFTAK